MGDDEDDEYILKKLSNDRLITFSKEGHLTTWNLVTGKHICIYHKPEIEINGFSIMNKNGNIAILVKQSEIVKDMKDEQFFEPW